MIGNRKKIMEVLAFGLAACGFGCFNAYGTNEQFQSAAGIGSGLRCIPELIKAATIAAISGAPTLAKLTPMAFNTATNKWVLWASATDVYTIHGTATGATFTLTVNGETTGTIAYNASAATVLAAVLALGNVDTGDFTASGGPIATTDVVLTVSSTGKLAGTAVTITLTDSTTGGTTTITHTTTAAAGVNGAGGIAFVWPEAVVTDATNDTLANLLFAGDIHFDDIVVPAGESTSTLKAMLRKYARALDYNIQGLDQFH